MSARYHVSFWDTLIGVLLFVAFMICIVVGGAGVIGGVAFAITAPFTTPLGLVAVPIGIAVFILGVLSWTVGVYILENRDY